MKKLYINLKKTYYLTFILFFGIYFNYAQTWENLGNLSINSENVTQISAIESFDNTTYFCTNKGLFISTDNGTTFNNLTWQSGITQNQSILCVYKDPDNGILYTGGTQAVYKSTDSGITWSATAITNIEGVNDICKANTNLIIAYGNTNLNGGVYYSTDDLETAIESTTIPDLQMIDLHFFNNNLYLAGKDAVYKSTDEGITWTVSGTGHPSGGKYFEIIEDNGTLFAGDVFGNGLYKSTDFGETWANTDPNTFTGFCQIFDVTAANGTIMAVMDGSQCVDGAPIKYSQDNGVSWNSAMFNLSSVFYSQLGRNSDGSCLFVNNNGSLSRICNLTLGLNSLQQNNITLLPNPTKGILTLEGVQQGDALLYNIQGQQLDTFIFNHENPKIDITEYPVGVYIIQVSNKQHNQSFKIIKSE